MDAITLYASFVEQYQKSRPPLAMTPPVWNDLIFHERKSWMWLAEHVVNVSAVEGRRLATKFNDMDIELRNQIAVLRSDLQARDAEIASLRAELKAPVMNKPYPITAEGAFLLERQAYAQTQIDEFKEASRRSYSYMVIRGFAPVYEQYAEILNKRFMTSQPVKPITAQQLFDLEQRALNASPKFKDVPRRPFSDVENELQAMADDLNAYFLGQPVVSWDGPSDPVGDMAKAAEQMGIEFGKVEPDAVVPAKVEVELQGKIDAKIDSEKLADEIKARLGTIKWIRPEMFDEFAREYEERVRPDGTQPIWMQRYQRTEKSRMSEIISEFVKFLKAKLTQ